MRTETSRRLVAALLITAAFSAGPMAGVARAQGSVPVPTASPTDAPAPPAGEGASVPAGDAKPSAEAGPAVPPTDVPVPEARPMPPPEAAAATFPAPDATPVPAQPPEPDAVPTPEPAPPPAGEGASEPAAAGTAPAVAEPAPQPAYVSPEKARTTAEPTAPETPPMEVTPAETVDAAAAVEDAMLCEADLEKRGATFTVGETIAEGDCGVLRPVELTKLSSGVTIMPGTKFLCRTALALDIWMSDSVEPAAKAELNGVTVKAISQASTYVCRARASESKISEHSRGSAIDIAALTLSDGRSLTVEAHAPGSADDRFSAAIRRGACGPFKTVLGPGTDSDHGTHLHLDIAARANGSLYCR